MNPAAGGGRSRSTAPGNYIPHVRTTYWACGSWRTSARSSSSCSRSARSSTGAAGSSSAAGSSGPAFSTIPLPYLAALAGWVLSEVGRQPWIVLGPAEDRRRQLAERLDGHDRHQSRHLRRPLRRAPDRRLRPHAPLRARRPARGRRRRRRVRGPGGELLMDLETFWFCLIAVLWAGYFLLEGFDFGVGMLLPFVPRNDEERGTTLRTIGPVWDGNEVWLVVAGGATFAAFPAWYATMFSGFYLALLLILVLPDRPRRLVRVARRRARRPAGGRRGPGRTRSAASARRCSGGSGSSCLVYGVPDRLGRRLRRRLRRPLQPVHACSRGSRSCVALRLPRRDVPDAAYDGRAARARADAAARKLAMPAAVAGRGVPRLDRRRRDRPQRQGPLPAGASRGARDRGARRSRSFFVLAGRNGGRSR